MYKTVLSSFLLLFLSLIETCGKEIFYCDFEAGLQQWQKTYSATTGYLTNSAANGRQAFEAKFSPGHPRGRKGNTALQSVKIPLGKGVYRLTAKVQFTENFGSSLGIEFYDQQNRKITSNAAYSGSKPESAEKWYDISITGYAYSDDTSYALIKLWMPVNLPVPQTIRIDDIRIEAVDVSPQQPPWKGQYKIHAAEKKRLTAADFPGPDGIVYPDFTRAGARDEVYNIPEAKVINIRDFGALPDGKNDCFPALQAAINALPPEGGIIKFEPGEYRLSRFISINKDHVILKGAGKNATKINLDYDTGDGMVDLYGLQSGDTLASGQPVHLYARPQKLKELNLYADGKRFGQLTLNVHSGNRSYLVSRLPGKLPPGEHQITGEALYQNGAVFKKTIKINIKSGIKSTLPYYPPNGVIHFRGNGFSGPEYLLAADGKRGSFSIFLQDEKHSLRPGDAVILRALETPQRKAETRNSCNWGTFRSTIIYIEKVEGKKITFNQPLRIDYPVRDKSFVRKVRLLKGGGITDMTLEQKTDYWSSTVLFDFASDCVAENIRVIKCRRNPIYANNAKFCSILNCEFDDAWFHGAGGTAYVGWEVAYDCLMDGVVTRNFRHAPMVQWSASGNVIRNGTFYHSDAQWHSGWTHENLFENCTVISDTRKNGGYGNAFWASAPEDGAHGPNGPRNVVYNCDAYSIRPAIWLGGMNEGWIFAYNHFRVKSGCGLFVKSASFDHVLKDNIFLLEDGKSPGVIFASPDCGGIELLGNKFYGAAMLYQGLQAPEVAKGNLILPAQQEAARPEIKVPSIYQWQLEQKKSKAD